jgi:hypothetical protein
MLQVQSLSQNWLENLNKLEIVSVSSRAISSLREIILTLPQFFFIFSDNYRTFFLVSDLSHNSGFTSESFQIFVSSIIQPYCRKLFQVHECNDHNDVVICTERCGYGYGLQILR